MDNLHTVLRSIRGETKSRRTHLTVFREFLTRLMATQGVELPGRSIPRPLARA